MLQLVNMQSCCNLSMDKPSYPLELEGTLSKDEFDSIFQEVLKGDWKLPKHPYHLLNTDSDEKQSLCQNL